MTAKTVYMGYTDTEKLFDMEVSPVIINLPSLLDTDQLALRGMKCDGSMINLHTTNYVCTIPVGNKGLQYYTPLQQTTACVERKVSYAERRK
jgi:hypothetical protein